MEEYHKIQTVFKRDPENKYKTLLIGKYSLPEFEYLAHNQWAFTEKVDGTNLRVMFDGEVITFGGRTDRAHIPAFLVNKLNEIFLPQSELFKEEFPDGICLYGEGYGAKIQKGGGNYSPDQGFVLFDVKIGGWWLNRSDVNQIAQDLNIDVVPMFAVGTLDKMVEIARNGFLSAWGDFRAEGFVARPITELRTRVGMRVITKIKCKDFPK